MSDPRAEPPISQAAESGGTPAYPPAPWLMAGQLWMSLFKLGHDVDELRPAGVYGAAVVSYEAPSPLTYAELLVARPLPKRGRPVSITDIWVDSPASVAGGRALWAIPKGLATFARDNRRRGPLRTTSWSVATPDRAPIASASFTDASHLAPRVPFRGATWQPPIDDHVTAVSAVMKGSAKALPCRAEWTFDLHGPLGWLVGATQLASVRMSGFRMSFG
ncbi:hypothetical protein [Nocardioides acrostichi]|uniref:Acetoacetate decarboxylase n=1 Tax=Nocardioides acrostichi TaxID=2784339 RepID=A0A930V0C0_9ACTN|nr:hypothetical protein [Nocardioides acrostichi]MBF4160894.1 hypothetical protein [Nocardioides acrostichi]